MKTLKFKTNIKCKSCVEKVKPFLEKKEGVQEWKVDLSSTDKTLTVKTETLDAESVKRTVSEAGFKAEEKKEGLLSKLFG